MSEDIININETETIEKQPSNEPKPKKRTYKSLIIKAIILIVVLLLIQAVYLILYIPFVARGKFSKWYSEASSIYKFANTAICENYEYIDPSFKLQGYCLISSDRKKNYNTESCNIDINVIYDKLEEEEIDCEWFLMIEDGIVTYSAASPSWNNRFSGSYPAGNIYYSPNILLELRDNNYSDPYEFKHGGPNPAASDSYKHERFPLKTIYDDALPRFKNRIADEEAKKIS
ncbi:MAG: hypothetical protein K5979_13680 [Ruminococcus sp.]|nr:hypothetical protein [Ruminococcus sp.]